jgi:hypothetical protein
VSGRDIGASVRQRLLNRARAERRPFQELLQYFAMERFLYRLASSPFVDRFVLKGALLLTAWKAPVTRPTMDIDLAAKTSNELEHMRSVVAELCQLDTEPDELEFAADCGRASKRLPCTGFGGRVACPEQTSGAGRPLPNPSWHGRL